MRERSAARSAWRPVILTTIRASRADGFGTSCCLAQLSLLAESDSDCLFSIGYFRAARRAGMQLAMLELVHHAAHVFRHRGTPGNRPEVRSICHNDGRCTGPVRYRPAAFLSIPARNAAHTHRHTKAGRTQRWSKACQPFSALPTSPWSAPNGLPVGAAGCAVNWRRRFGGPIAVSRVIF